MKPKVTSNMSPLYQRHTELARLERGIQRSRGFSLYFAICNSRSYTLDLIKDLSSNLSLSPIILELTKDDESVENAIDNVLIDATEGAPLFVTGLENLLPYGEEQRNNTLRELNWRREALARFDRPIVLWLPTFAVKVIQEGAPDFSDWKSGYYEFELPEEVHLAEVKDRVKKQIEYERNGKWGDIRRNSINILMLQDSSSHNNFNAYSSNNFQLVIAYQELMEYEKALSYIDLAFKFDASFFISQILFCTAHISFILNRYKDAYKSYSDCIRYLADHWNFNDEKMHPIVEAQMFNERFYLLAYKELYLSSMFEISDVLLILGDYEECEKKLDNTLETAYQYPIIHRLYEVQYLQQKMNLHDILGQNEQRDECRNKVYEIIGMPTCDDSQNHSNIWLDYFTKLFATSSLDIISPDLQMRILCEKLSELRQLERICLICYYKEGLCIKQISDIINMPFAITCSHFRRGLHTLQTMILSSKA